MLTLLAEVIERPAYRPYRAVVARLERLSASFTRVTFSSDDFTVFGTAGLDQRIKLLFPTANGLPDLGEDGTDWYAAWRALPEAERSPLRTFTVRSVRQEAREIDVDFVTHGRGGPAANWLTDAAPGDPVIVVGPDARSSGHRAGIDWHPGDARHVLLAGDETAAPAICAILESLPSGHIAHAFIEVDDAADALSPTLSEGVNLTWVARSAGEDLPTAVAKWTRDNREVIRSAIRRQPQALSEVDIDSTLLWEVPTEGHGDFYAWIAGEAGAVKAIRRTLVSDNGIDRSKVAFMGYWRQGRSEP